MEIPIELKSAKAGCVIDDLCVEVRPGVFG